MDISDLSSFITDSGVLPPTLSAELARNVGRLSPEETAWLIAVIDRAKRADELFGRTSFRYLECIRELEEAAFARAEDTAAQIMVEFERQLSKKA